MRRYEQGQEVVKGVKIISHIGAGGFGTVYKVSVPGGVEKALKIINLQGTQGVREYNALKLIKKISHPNLVSIDSYWLRDLQGKLLDFSSDDSINAEKQSLELIILMGLGRMSLHDLLTQYINQGKEGIPFAELIKLMSATAEAIDYLNEPHDLGLKEPVAIQHGDIKPGNILLVGNSVQVCDYGLAKAITTSKGARTSIALFSPGYCSPEMNRNQPSNWSDQFSLAISYYELRTGKLPFNEEEEINAGIVAALGKLDYSGVTKAEREVLLKATNPIPNQRYPKCTDFIDALQASGHSSARDSGPKPRTLEEVLQPDSEVVPGYKLVQRISQGERDEFWKATTSAGKPFIIYVIREFRGALGNQLLQSLESLRQLDEHENLINLRNCWMIHVDGRVMPYIDAGSLENQTVALVALLDNVDCTLEDYYNECVKKRHSQGIPDHELLQFMMQAAKSVDYLTQLGYTEYLDLKPQTILLTKNKNVKLGISGLAKRLMSGFSSLTTDRLVNAFAPPELFDFEVGKHWNSNQYSLALTYYWLRSLGHLPFPADSSPKQIREYHLRGQLDFSDVPEREQNILYNATVLDPNQRFANCYEFVDAMQIAMGVSVPQYAAYSSPHTPTPRHTPNRIDTPISINVPQEVKPTDHIERRQQVTPVVIPKQKTPQSPPRKADPYSTINELPSLPVGYGQDEIQDEVSPHEVAHQTPLLAPAKRVTPVEVDVEETQELRSAFRQINNDKKSKRRRTALMISMMGMLLAGVIGAVMFWKFNDLNGGGVVQTTLPVKIPSVVVPSVVSPTPEELAKLVEEELAKPDYLAAWNQIALANQSKDWTEKQKENVRQKLVAALDPLIQKHVDNLEFQKAEVEVAKQAGKYQAMLDVDWEPQWKKKIASKMSAATDATRKWTEVKGKLKDLGTLKQLTDYQDELQALVDTADEAMKKESAPLLDSVKTLVKLSNVPLKNDAESLLTRLRSYTEWKQKTDAELQKSGCALAVPKAVLKEAEAGFVTTTTQEGLLKYEHLLKMLFKDNKEVEWIRAGLLEIASLDSNTRTNETETLAKAFSPSSGYGQFVKAAWFSQTKSGETNDHWFKVYPPNTNWDQQVIVPFRLKLAESSLAKQLDTCRVGKGKLCDFKADKRIEALNTIKLLLALRSKLQPEAKHDEILLAEQALLDEESTTDSKGSKLRAYTNTPGFKKLHKEYQGAIISRLNKFGPAKDTPIGQRIEYARWLLDEFHLGHDVTEAEVIERVIVAFKLDEIDSLVSTVPASHKAQFASLLSELAEDIVFDKKDWMDKLEAKKVSPETVHGMLKAAIQLNPDDGRHYLRSIMLQYDRGNPANLKQWIEYSEWVSKIQQEYFGTHLIKGIVLYMAVRNEGTGITSARKLISQLIEADAEYDMASKLLSKLELRHRDRYRFHIALDRSNIALRIANLQYETKLQKQFLKSALDYAQNAVTLDKKNPEASDNMGIVVEDHAMLLGEEQKYSDAITEFSNAIGDLGESLRNKPLLHRARCYYRWGNATGNTEHYEKALRDFETFLSNKLEPVIYQIEARYFRAMTYYEKASLRKKDSPEFGQFNALAAKNLKEAVQLIKSNSVDLWKRKLSYEYLDRMLIEMNRVILKSGKKHEVYSIDAKYKESMAEVEEVRAINSNDKALALYIAAKLAESNEKQADQAKKLALVGYDNAIKLAKQSNVPDLEVMTRAYKARMTINEEDKKYLEMHADANDAYLVTTQFNMAKTVRFEFLKDATIAAFNAFIIQNEDAYWSKARDHLLTSMRNFPKQINDKQYANTIVHLVQNSLSSEKDKNTADILKAIEEIAASVEPEYREKYKRIHDQISKSLQISK